MQKQQSNSMTMVFKKLPVTWRFFYVSP